MCGTAACDRDCALSAWGKCGECSKGCVASGGKEASWQGRERGVSKPAVGAGRCPAQDAKDRQQFRKCSGLPTCTNTQKCVNAMDVVVLIDASGSVDDTRFAALVKK